MTSILLAAAISGLVSGVEAPNETSSVQSDLGTAGAEPLDGSKGKEKHACKGQNACKGQGGCKG